MGEEMEENGKQKSPVAGLVMLSYELLATEFFRYDVVMDQDRPSLAKLRTQL